MKRLLFATILCGFIGIVSAQKVLIIENLSKGKSYKMFVGDKIRVMTNASTKKISGSISEILDSSVVISNTYLYNLGEIKVVYRDRAGFQLISSFFLVFGVAFFTLDAVNNAINNDPTIFRPEAAIISASSLAVGGTMWAFRHKKCTIEKDHWRLKIINLLHTKQE